MSINNKKLMTAALLCGDDDKNDDMNVHNIIV